VLYSVVLDSKAKTARASNPDAMPMGSAMGEIYSMLIVGQENLDEKIMREVKGQVVFTSSKGWMMNQSSRTWKHIVSWRLEAPGRSSSEDAETMCLLISGGNQRPPPHTFPRASTRWRLRFEGQHSSVLSSVRPFAFKIRALVHALLLSRGPLSP
jgi:hypothetical protein